MNNVMLEQNVNYNKVSTLNMLKCLIFLIVKPIVINCTLSYDIVTVKMYLFLSFFLTLKT